MSLEPLRYIYECPHGGLEMGRTGISHEAGQLRSRIGQIRQQVPAGLHRPQGILGPGQRCAGALALALGNSDNSGSPASGSMPLATCGLWVDAAQVSRRTTIGHQTLPVLPPVTMTMASLSSRVACRVSSNPIEVVAMNIKKLLEPSLLAAPPRRRVLGALSRSRVPRRPMPSQPRMARGLLVLALVHASIMCTLGQATAPAQPAEASASKISQSKVATEAAAAAPTGTQPQASAASDESTNHVLELGAASAQEALQGAVQVLSLIHI